VGPEGEGVRGARGGVRLMRISATTVESFHLYRTTEWMTEERFVEQLDDFTPTPQILRGMAFEKILTDPDRYLKPEGFEADGILFPRMVVEPSLAHIPEGVIWQAKATKVYTVEGEEITVVTKSDGQLGRSVLEIKTTERFDLDKYRNSLQWRFYLDVFGADVCRYLVFEIAQSKRNGELYLKSINTWEEHPYEGMFGDLMEELGQLVRFIHLRGLEGKFQPRGETAFV